MNLLFESTIIGLIAAVFGIIYIKIMEETPYKTYVPCIFYIIGFMVYLLYHIKDFRSIYCITGLCNKRIGNIVIYDDDNNVIASGRVHFNDNDEASLNSSGGGSIDHIAFLFSARDFQPIKESIERDGVDHLHTIVPGLELRQIFLKDPDGIRIELNFPPE